MELRAQSEEELEENMEDDVEAMVGIWEDLHEEVTMRQIRYDRDMVKQYLRQRQLAEQDVRFIFAPGDPVLLRAKEPGKLKCRAVGPYVFQKYTGSMGVTSVITNAQGKTYTVNAGNLLPVHTNGAARMLRFDPSWDPAE